ncbi:MAG TPA: RNA polymerase sigma factor [bacterium]
MDDLSLQIEQQIPRLRRYAQALVGDSTRADDIVQDCLERAWTKIHLFRPGSDLRAWLFTILHNVHANAARRYNTSPAMVPLVDENLAPSTRATQLDELEVGDLKDALARLSDDQRQVILMVGMEQMRYEEVAHVLDIPIGTVMSRLHRARERLRELLTVDLRGPVRKAK